MKAIYIMASIALVLLMVASAGANSQNNSKATVCTPAQPASTAAGPVVCPVVAKSTVDCCEVAPSSCGAFCQAGQQSPGWPYNWCSQYWLRPNTNY
ncbi:MAG: hypothetical protein ACOX3G_05115 [Armatimonadota bacterium]